MSLPSYPTPLIGHATVGGVTGGLDGALGAGASAMAAPLVMDALTNAGVPLSVAQALTNIGATVLGNAVGGTDGAVAAHNEASNNGVLGLARGAVLGAPELAAACVRSAVCVRLVGADALAAVIGTGLAATVTLGDVNPTVFGGSEGFEAADAGEQPTHTGNTKPVPNLGNTTTTPGDAQVAGGTPGYTSPNPVGDSSTVTVNPGPQGGTVVMSDGSGANGGVTTTVIEPKIAQQMGNRGWTAESIDATISNPAKTVVTKDTRFDPISGTRLNDPATGYVAKDGSYVVRNDRTGQVVQVSNKTDPTWKAPWDK